MEKNAAACRDVFPHIHSAENLLTVDLVLSINLCSIILCYGGSRA